MTIDSKARGKDFIRQNILSDLAESKNESRVFTRFPPEPNGYLHIGHAQSICLNYGIANEFEGRCYLRFDDTNPTKESEDYVDAIKQDVLWLGFNWEKKLTHASDYFEEFYNCALQLIEDENAYVDSQTAEEIKNSRGTLNTSGTESPYRNRSVAENMGLFERMRNGEFENGEHVLRAKIDMTAANINLRDPVLYRILNTKHQKTGSHWCIYPLYDFAHTISDAIEGITHSLCTLEFEDHRPLYEWILDHLTLPYRPRQIEFSRLNLEHTITSKRKLSELVDKGLVEGWNDPRMPTISGMRRRGYPASAIRDFCSRVGVTKKEKSIQIALLENSVRQELDTSSPRAMAVIKPLKVIIDNYPENQIESLIAANHPKNQGMGTRTIPFSKEIYIEESDFMENPSAKFFRLKPGGEVRLRFGYIIKCEELVKDSNGDILEIHCSYDPDTKSGSGISTRKVKGTIHWVSAQQCIYATLHLYETLMSEANPNSIADINPESLRVIENAALEESLMHVSPGDRFQFERSGYFVVDKNSVQTEKLIFNRIVTLRDSWAKIKNISVSKK
jgi:glutaminyl-tRNA synthetase